MGDGWKKTVSAGTGFVYLDLIEREECVATLRVNPADVKLAQRCEEVSSFFENLRDLVPESATLEDAAKLNTEIEDKICYLLGYDAKQKLFGQISATSIMTDGNLFVVNVMDQIMEAVGPEIQKRQRTMEKAVEKHTAKYTK